MTARCRALQTEACEIPASLRSPGHCLRAMAKQPGEAPACSSAGRFASPCPRGALQAVWPSSSPCRARLGRRPVPCRGGLQAACRQPRPPPWTMVTPTASTIALDGHSRGAGRSPGGLPGLAAQGASTMPGQHAVAGRSRAASTSPALLAPAGRRDPGHGAGLGAPGGRSLEARRASTPWRHMGGAPWTTPTSGGGRRWVGDDPAPRPTARHEPWGPRTRQGPISRR